MRPATLLIDTTLQMVAWLAKASQPLGVRADGRLDWQLSTLPDLTLAASWAEWINRYASLKRWCNAQPLVAVDTDRRLTILTCSACVLGSTANASAEIRAEALASGSMNNANPAMVGSWFFLWSSQ